MELVDRYLNAVKFWLPRNQQDDIIAELSEDLRSQIEDKESELGRKLTDAEVELIVKRCGPPMAVAGRYLPQRFLIGPALFPIYSKVIRSLISYLLLPWLLLWIGIAIFSPNFRAEYPGAALFASLEPWWLACTYSLFICTLIFALVDRSQERSCLADTWNPRKLPAVRDPNRIPRCGTIFQLALVVAILTILVQLHREFHFFGLTMTLSRQWAYFVWALIALNGAEIAITCLNLSQARWTRLSASLRIGLDVYGCSLLYLMCRARLLQSLSGAGVSSADAARLVNSINNWMAISAIWVILIGIVVLVFDVRRVIRVSSAA